MKVRNQHFVFEYLEAVRIFGGVRREPLIGFFKPQHLQVGRVIGKEMPKKAVWQSRLVFRGRFKIGRQRFELEIVFLDVRRSLLAHIAHIAVERALLAGGSHRRGHSYLFAVRVAYRSGRLGKQAYRHYHLRQFLHGRFQHVAHSQMWYLLCNLRLNVVAVHQNCGVFAIFQIVQYVGRKVGRRGVHRHFYLLASKFSGDCAHCLSALIGRALVGYHKQRPLIFGKNFKELFDRVLGACGNLLLAAPHRRPAQPRRRVYYLGKRKPSKRAYRAFLVKRNHSCRYDFSALYAQVYFAMFRAHCAPALDNLVGLAKPFAPPVRQAACRAGVYARSAKQAFLRAPRPSESRGYARLLAAVGYAYRGL